ncbi:MAB_1171c family putative transporter [Streptomyces sp. NPDC002514]|uniref:MAB_1171c family putative transporter n=1 Tax=unclassified Streptomyces TaxID=2593676 RepID=UPI003673DA56
MSLVVYIAALVFFLAAVVIFRHPRTAPRNPLTLPTCASICLGALTFFCAAPTTLAAFNRFTGIPNAGAPLTYSALSAYSGSLLILLIHWRGGPPRQVRRMVRAGMAVYASLIITIIVLFFLADAGTERLQDLDTYYANTRYLREMIVLYLAGHLASTIMMSLLCLRWVRDEVTGLLRTGLRLILAGLTLDVTGFVCTKATAVVARWLGYDLDFLSTTVAPPAASLGALLCAAGFVLPGLVSAVAAQRRSLTEFRSLEPLWLEVRDVATVPKPQPSCWQLPRTRLHLLEVSIHDALLRLAAEFDDRVGEEAYQAAVEQGHTSRSARAASEAAMTVEAARRNSVDGDASTAHPAKYRLTSELLDLADALARVRLATPRQAREQ